MDDSENLPAVVIVPVIRKLTSQPEAKDQAAGDGDGKTRNIDQGIQSFAIQIPQNDLNMVFEHGVSFLADEHRTSNVQHRTSNEKQK
jgi:hypothetical protein